MTPADMADVLTAAAAYDGRTIGVYDIGAWHAAVGELDREDALNAVVRHYGNTTDRLMPAHLKNEALAIRNERAAQQQHEIRALPSRFEEDPERTARVRRGIAEIARRWSVPEKGAADPVRDRALERAKQERGKRPNPVKAAKRAEGKPLELTKVTQGPDWTNPALREAESVRALHQADRPCGLARCPRCNERAFGGPNVPAS